MTIQCLDQGWATFVLGEGHFYTQLQHRGQLKIWSTSAELVNQSFGLVW